MTKSWYVSNDIRYALYKTNASWFIHFQQFPFPNREANQWLTAELRRIPPCVRNQNHGLEHIINSVQMKRQRMEFTRFHPISMGPLFEVSVWKRGSLSATLQGQVHIKIFAPLNDCCRLRRKYMYNYHICWRNAGWSRVDLVRSFHFRKNTPK